MLSLDELMNPATHRNRTLGLCSVLHAFTHIYHVAPMPLYLLIQRDLQLESVEQATLLVTAMMVAYFVPSFPVGSLADRVSRKKLLAFGLALNAVGYILLACAPDYRSALVAAVVAGLGGSFFHPAATALIANLFPVGTGRALGIIGVGASAGFFLGPLYSGWRAMTATAGWRAPVLELGIAGLVVAGLFAWLAEDETAKRTAAPARIFSSPRWCVLFLFMGLAFSFRDFAGSGMASLSSLFLQKAHHFDSKMTGMALSAIFLASAISNPWFGKLSDQGRIRWTTFVLVCAAAMIAIFPYISPAFCVLILAGYGFFFMASYPMVEAALMESVTDTVRGRVFGLFITLGGLLGNLSHWIVGDWVKRLGPAAAVPDQYRPIYLTLALMVLASLAGLPLLHRFRREGARQTGPHSPGAAASIAELQP